MHLKPKPLVGWLTTESTKIEVETRFATKYSILIVLKERTRLNKISDFQLKVEDDVISLGPCKIITQPENQMSTFLIIPEVNFYNFEKLFYRSKLENLETALMSLPLLINYKNELKPEFKEFVSNLTYDLNVYSHLFTQADKASKDEPAAVREHIQTRLINGLGTNLNQYLKKSLEQLERIVSPFSQTEHEHHGFYFRKQLWLTLMQAPIIARTNLKPRGYIGDSEIMRMIYSNDYQGDSTFGRILHKFSVDQPAADSVRNRRHIIAGIIRAIRERGQFDANRKMRVLSIACGPAVELGDILTSSEDCSQMHFSLLDQDIEALSEAGSLISMIENSLNTKISNDIIKESVRIMLLNPDYAAKWGKFDFIYSMGLFDYFTTPVATSVLNKLYELLNPNGEMAIGNFHTSNPSLYYMEYWHDWKIIHRTEEDFLELTKELDNAACHIHYDDLKIQMFLRIKNNNRLHTKV